MNALQNLKVVGYFSLPSPSLAEHNPAAYELAMAGAPKGAGTCSHCGTGIRHHVVLEDGRFIGTTCAESIGLEEVRDRLTTAQAEARDARLDQKWSEYQAVEQARQEFEASQLALRKELVGDLIDLLERLDTDFHRSLAQQLTYRPLSERQASFVAKATSSTGRRNKANSQAWDDVMDRCTAKI